MDQPSQIENGNLRALDGREIPYVFQRSRAANGRGVFLLLHGLGVDKDEYLKFYHTLSDLLSENGFDVLRIDFPAHGESKASSRDFSLVNCVADAITAAKFAAERNHHGSLNIFGTSFGAGPAVVAASFFREALGNLTLLAPALNYRDLYIYPTHPIRKSKYRDFFRHALLHDRRIAIGERVFLTWCNAVEFALIDLEYHLSMVADRTAILHGMADSMVPYEFSQEISQRFPAIDVRFIKGMDHGFMDQEDELGTGRASQNNLHVIFAKAVR